MLKALCLHYLHDQWEQDGVGGCKGCGQQPVLDMEGQSEIGGGRGGDGSPEACLSHMLLPLISGVWEPFL